VETPNSVAEFDGDLEAMILVSKRLQTLCPVIQGWGHYRKFDSICSVKFSSGELAARILHNNRNRGLANETKNTLLLPLHFEIRPTASFVRSVTSQKLTKPLYLSPSVVTFEKSAVN
jgi:hypothetical protein